MGFEKIEIEIKRNSEKIIVIKVSKDNLERAGSNLLELADIFGPMFRKLNADGDGEQDEKEVRQDLQIGAAACLTLLNLMEQKTGSAVQ